MCSGEIPAVLSEVGSTAMMKLACVKTRWYLIWTERGLDGELKPSDVMGTNRFIVCPGLRTMFSLMLNYSVDGQKSPTNSVPKLFIFVCVYFFFTAQPSLLALPLLLWEMASLSLLIPQRVVCVSVANQYKVNTVNPVQISPYS